MQNLIHYFYKIGISEDDLTNFIQCLEIREYKTGDLILSVGETENFLSYINKGIVRYYIEKGEKEITIDFAFEDSFYCAYDSFYTRKPSLVNIIAITDCELYSVSFDSLEKLSVKCATARQMSAMTANFLLRKKTKRELDLLTKTPAELYDHLCKAQKNLVQKIPQKYLASYIGVVPETLSRIRSRNSY